MVANRPAGNTVAQRLHAAGKVDAGGVRQDHRNDIAQVAATNGSVDRVERGSRDAHQHLAGRRARLVDVVVAQDLGTTVVEETYSLHHTAPCGAVVASVTCSSRFLR